MASRFLREEAPEEEVLEDEALGGLDEAQCTEGRRTDECAHDRDNQLPRRLLRVSNLRFEFCEVV